MVGTAFGAILMATIKNGLSLLNVNTFCIRWSSVSSSCLQWRWMDMHPPGRQEWIMVWGGRVCCLIADDEINIILLIKA